MMVSPQDILAWKEERNRGDLLSPYLFVSALTAGSVSPQATEESRDFEYGI